jgi:hypothetical protein
VTPLPKTLELLRVARRVIWFEEPERALADPVQFLAHAMAFGSIEEVRALRESVGKEDYRAVLASGVVGLSRVDRVGVDPERVGKGDAGSRPQTRFQYAHDLRRRTYTA